MSFCLPVCLSVLPTHHYVSQVTHHCHHIAIKHGSQQFSDWQQNGFKMTPVSQGLGRFVNVAQTRSEI